MGQVMWMVVTHTCFCFRLQVVVDVASALQRCQRAAASHEVYVMHVEARKSRVPPNTRAHTSAHGLDLREWKARHHSLGVSCLRTCVCVEKPAPIERPVDAGTRTQMLVAHVQGRREQQWPACSTRMGTRMGVSISTSAFEPIVNYARKIDV